MELYKAIATALSAHESCRKSGNDEWLERWAKRLERYDSMLPSGAGFDKGSVVVKADSSDTKIVIETSFHHMDEHGGYAEWTDHRIIIKPSLAHGITIDNIGGRNINDIKDYIGEVFAGVLWEDVDESLFFTVGGVEQ